MVDRERELQALKKRFSSNDLELIIIYGRRRIGKTFLILNAVNGYDFIYYLATEKTI
jgi:AAA+ ATPase superfamily predicted ATPase